MLFICIETMALKKKKTSKKNSSSSKTTHREVLEEIIRVDHAGEYGATKIYDGQIAILEKAQSSEKQFSIWLTKNKSILINLMN